MRPSLAALVLVLLAVPAALFGANPGGGPTPPDSPLRKLVGELAQKRPAAVAQPPAKDALLRPEFRFKPAGQWLLFPELAKTLGTNAEERAVVLQLLEQGTRELKTHLAAEGADNDVAVATALFLSQLWQLARGREMPEADVDALHAQLAGALAGPEVAKLRDADKQRWWEFCVGYPLFLAGMGEVIETDAQRADLRKAAALGFESLLGVSPELVDFGATGLTIRAGLQDAAAKLAAEKSAPASNRVAPAAPAREPNPGFATDGIRYDQPAGWSAESADGAVIFRATLGDVERNGQPVQNNQASHQANLGVLRVLTATRGATALFDQTWRDQFGQFDLGDTFVHYRARLPSGLVVLYMGKFFEKPNAPRAEGNPRMYGALYLVELGADRYQPIVAFVFPRSESIGMDQFKEGGALQALWFPLTRFLDTVRPAKGAAPHPTGGFFAPADLRGNWEQSSGALGASFVNTMTGASAGQAMSAAAGYFRLQPDGRYSYAFNYQSSNPQFGRQGGATEHSGTYRLNGDIVLIEPSRPIGYDFTCCAVGTGVQQTPSGPRRILVTVSAGPDGTFRAPSFVPNWNNYDGVMTWYREER